MSVLSLTLFGAPRIERDGAAVTVERRKSMALLAYLAATPGAHSRATLATLLWPESDERAAHAGLRRALVDLRQAIGPEWLAAEGDRLALPDAPGLRVDVRGFRASLAAVAHHGHGRGEACANCLAELSRAAELYAGDLLAGFTLRDAPEFDTWQTLQGETLRLELAEVLEQLAEGYAGRGEPDRGLPHARRWLNLDPLCEPAHRCLMRLHAVAGDRRAALQQYAACQEVLRKELSIPPEPETSALLEAIRGGSATEPAPVLPLSRSSAPPHNLPPDPTPLVGREGELAHLAERCADPACRLVTIVGPGGVGKTRLAIQAARAQVAHFRDGVCFVDLAPVGSAELLASALLRALAAPGAGGVAEDERLLAYLADKQMLLVLDNFEHLLDCGEGAPGAGGQGSGGVEQATKDAIGLLVAILRSAPGVKLLVTSRERLHLREEWLAPLEGLAVPRDLEHEDTKGHEAHEARMTRSETPDPARFVSFAPLRDFAIQPATLERYSATALFLACVRRLRPDFMPTAKDAHHIACICRLLEGMPLGIELAAPWAGKLPLVEIADELAAGLDLLTTTLRDVPPRHRSMRAAFAHSWRLLSQGQRSILRQLSVFRGGFTREAGEAVAGATLAELSALVDSSWLRAEPSGRYSRHELIRQYCGERLEAEHAAEVGETADQVRLRHCRYQEAFMAGQYARINVKAQASLEIIPELGNLEAAWRWALARGELDDLYHLANGLALVFLSWGLLQMAGHLFDLAIDLLERQATLGVDEWAYRRGAARLIGYVYHYRTELSVHLGQLAQAGDCLARSLWLLRRAALTPDRTEARVMLALDQAQLLRVQGDTDEAMKVDHAVLRCLAKTEVPLWPYRPEVGALNWQASAYVGLGSCAFYQGRYGEARDRLQEAVACWEGFGEQRYRAQALSLLARILEKTGAYGKAEELAREGLRDSQAFGDRTATSVAQIMLGRLESSAGRQIRAREYLNLALAVAQETGNYRLRSASLHGLGAMALVCGDLDEAQRLYGESRSSFERLGIAGTLGYAEAVIGQGNVALASGDVAGARTHFREALAARACTAWEKMDAIAGIARVSASEGDTSRAVELLSLVAHHPFTSHATRERVKTLLAELEAELPPDVYEAAMARGRARELDVVVAELTAERDDDPESYTPERAQGRHGRN